MSGSPPLGQVEHNTESTDRQYAPAERAVRLGGTPGRGADHRRRHRSQRHEHRGSFRVRRLTTLVGLGQVGIVLALEVSRPARNNSGWYRLRTWPPTIRGYSTTRMPDVLVEPGALVPEQYLDVRVAGDPGPQRPLQRGLVDELLACERPHFNSS